MAARRRPSLFEVAGADNPTRPRPSPGCRRLAEQAPDGFRARWFRFGLCGDPCVKFFGQAGRDLKAKSGSRPVAGRPLFFGLTAID